MAPKRPADAFAPSSFPTDRSTTSLSGKRQRYAPPNASTVLSEPLADDLELDLEGTGGTQNSKKKIVVTDGYDSDSSGGEDESGFGGGKRRKAAEGAQKAGEEEEDEDMFGAVEDELDGKGKESELERKKGGKEWLEMGDIEGQEFSKRDMRDDEEDAGVDDGEEEEELEEEYEEVDDHANDDDAPRSRRSKKGMGFQLSSFNMQEELAEGRFSADGSYVANAIDPLATHDSWLNGLSKMQIKQAREAKERMDAKNREREKEESMRGEEQLTQLRDDCLIGLLSEVREGETVAGALNRLGRSKKRVEQLQQDSEGGGRGGESTTKTSSKSISRYTNKINRLTHFASTLLSSHGELEIYDQRYENIIKTLKMEGAVRRDWVPPTDTDEDQEIERIEMMEWTLREQESKEQKKGDLASGSRDGRSRVVISRPTTTGSTAATAKYWYKWNPAPEGQNPDEKYGPFERNELESWIQQGYFGDSEASRILVKKDGDLGEFRKWSEMR
ncbi:uncharacterized protein JCM6883_002888 [Sporobolomyces salmoneus]|uniref:uncharacterized protein n=1 Tax=Sporobolomyces salmoneus TaxID=183962 RepID=UPI00317140FC